MFVTFLHSTILSPPTPRHEATQRFVSGFLFGSHDDSASSQMRFQGLWIASGLYAQGGGHARPAMTTGTGRRGKSKKAVAARGGSKRKPVGRAPAVRHKKKAAAQ
jgi:hypothetical protein